MKKFGLFAALVAFTLIFAACSGDAGTDGTVTDDPIQDDKVLVDQNGDPVDPDKVTISTEGDPADPVKDPETTEDPVDDPIAYPEPGTVEYWLDIIPGTWKQSPDCVDVETPSTCQTELTISHVEDVQDGKLACPDSEWIIEGNFAGIGFLCIEAGMQITMCKNLDMCAAKASGELIEEVVDEGTCTQKADGMPTSCVRHADCAGVLPSATCANMQVEHWLKFCEWDSGQGSCEKGTSYNYLRL